MLLTRTLGDYGMAWDEGFTVEREERLLEWLARVVGDTSIQSHAWSPLQSMLERRADYLSKAGPEADSPWSRPSLHYYWQFAREEPNGHPPLYALLGLAGRTVSRHILPPPESYRFGPAALFALTLGVMYGQMTRWYGAACGLLSALGLLLMPRVFAHAHLASYDIPTLCFWFLAIVAFARSVEPDAAPGRARWLGPIAFGLAFGGGMATKFTGWLIPVPILAWVVLYRERRGLWTLLIGSVVAAAVVYLTNPTWWTAPYEGVAAFLKSNLTRQSLRPIPTLFLGQIYRFALPWYNTLLWTGVVVPPATLILGLVGAGRVVANRKRDRVGVLLLICWVFFLVLKALPNAPGHDSERLFLAAFAFLACLAGIGLAGLSAWLEARLRPIAARSLIVATLLAVLGASGWSTWRFHPLQLSYYNVFIGGLSGATRAGLEPTYYWEAVTPDVRQWLNEHTEVGGSVAFDLPAITFEYLHHWGRLRPASLTPAGKRPRWFVVMNRPGHLAHPQPTLGGYLLERAKPAYVKRLDAAPDVPLVLIYDGADADAAQRARTRRQPDLPTPH